jgi:hypothetical protein
MGKSQAPQRLAKTQSPNNKFGPSSVATCSPLDAQDKVHQVTTILKLLKLRTVNSTLMALHFFVYLLPAYYSCAWLFRV